MGYQFVIEHSKKICPNNLIKLSNFKYKNQYECEDDGRSYDLVWVILTAFVYIVGAPRNVTDMMKYKNLYHIHICMRIGKVKSMVKKQCLFQTICGKKDHFKELTISYAQLPSETRTTRHIVLSNTMYNAIADFWIETRLTLQIMNTSWLE